MSRLGIRPPTASQDALQKPVAQDLVILVDENDRQLGVMPKLEAHIGRHLHRAVSGFIFSHDGKLLIQRRAEGKYHSGGLWANSCCSHPRPSETNVDCMERRIEEELGLRCPMRSFGTLSYDANVGAGLWENELVHAFIGRFDGSNSPNPEEVSEQRWISEEDLGKASSDGSVGFAPWFEIYIAQGLVNLAYRSQHSRGR